MKRALGIVVIAFLVPAVFIFLSSKVFIKPKKVFLPGAPGFSEIVYGPQSQCLGKASSAEGDFDDDGIKDEAKIIRKNGQKEEFLYVWLSSKKYQPLILEDITDSRLINNMSLSLAKKDAFLYTQCGGPSFLFQWEPTVQVFKKTRQKTIEP